MKQKHIIEKINKETTILNPQYIIRDRNNKKLFGISVKLDEWCTVVVDIYQSDKKKELLNDLSELKQQFQDVFNLPVRLIDAKDLAAQITDQLQEQNHQMCETMDILTGEFVLMELTVKK